jgi:chromosomal replication initiation ATPase DnaA
MNPWDQILSRVETKVNRRVYTWFKPTSFVSEETAAITVRVPSTLFKDWLTKHDSGVISEAMGEVKKASLAVNFEPDAQADAGTTPSVPTKPRRSKLRLP